MIVQAYIAAAEKLNSNRSPISKLKKVVPLFCPMNPYGQSDFNYLPPNPAYGAPPYYATQQQLQPSLFPAPSIRVVDPQVAYSREPRPHSVLSVSAYDHQASILPHEEYTSNLNQNGYLKPGQSSFHPAVPETNGSSSPRGHLTDPLVSPIKQHINQIREEAEEWRRKWMASQVASFSHPCIARFRWLAKSVPRNRDDIRTRNHSNRYRTQPDIARQRPAPSAPS